jgi:FtsH-binding integral membrane protein
VPISYTKGVPAAKWLSLGPDVLKRSTLEGTRADSRTPQMGAATGARTADIDEGLRAHMNKVYGLMSLAMVVTAAIAYTIGTSNAALETIFTNTPLLYAIMFGPLALVLVLNFSFARLSVGALNGIFWAYAALTGASLSVIFVMFNLGEIFVALGVTSVAFLGLSLVGYTTKRDLGPIGAFLIMGAWGLVALTLGAWVFGIGISSGMEFAINLLALVIFAGLTAYYTQSIKNEYLQARTYGGPEADQYLEKAAIVGALSLYISFIAMFRSILFLLSSND